MNVFVLCTGRCGSTTFARACSHITNYTSTHESRHWKHGPGRLDYPDNHIEVDNRLSWLLGRLDRRYGQSAFYVHLTRNPEEAASVAGGALKHAALVTGLKHYLGSFDKYAQQEVDTPFTEDQPRVPGDNFYYTQEDILFCRGQEVRLTWSVARLHTILGYSPGNAMNLGTSLAVYATLCKETGRWRGARGVGNTGRRSSSPAAHSGHRQAYFCRRHLGFAAALASAGSS